MFKGLYGGRFEKKISYQSKAYNGIQFFHVTRLLHKKLDIPVQSTKSSINFFAFGKSINGRRENGATFLWIHFFIQFHGRSIVENEKD